MNSSFDSQVSPVQADGEQVLTLAGTIDALSAGMLLGAARSSVARADRAILARSRLERLDTCAPQVLLALRRTLRLLEFVRLRGAERLLLSSAEPPAQSAAAHESIQNMTDTETRR
jgi:anti-anti-sigma regulatory factor